MASSMSATISGDRERSGRASMSSKLAAADTCCSLRAAVLPHHAITLHPAPPDPQQNNMRK